VARRLEGLPFERLYLIKADNQWPVYACESASQAIVQVKTLKNQSDDPHNIKVRVWLLTPLGAQITVEELELQQKVIQETLVPAGLAVKE